MIVVQWNSLGEICLEGNSGYKPQILRQSVGVVQWAWSSGCSPVGVSQDESVEHKGSQRCGLEGNSGCGLVGD